MSSFTLLGSHLKGPKQTETSLSLLFELRRRSKSLGFAEYGATI
jgi:hypothetical protein